MDITSVIQTTAMTYFAQGNSTENGTLNETFVRNLMHDHLYRENSFVIGLLVYLYIPVFLAGLIGNGLLMLIILSKRRLRNGTNLFLCNLAFADLCGEYPNTLQKESLLFLIFKSLYKTMADPLVRTIQKCASLSKSKRKIYKLFHISNFNSNHFKYYRSIYCGSRYNNFLKPKIIQIISTNWK